MALMTLVKKLLKTVYYEVKSRNKYNFSYYWKIKKLHAKSSIIIR